MSASITIKRHNHYLYHCDPSRHAEMLAHLMASFATAKILLAITDAENLTLETVPDNVTVLSDDAILPTDKKQYDVVIHADLPEKALQYMTRLSLAKEQSIGLLIPEEAKRLYPIETLLGRNIMQKFLEGFEPPQRGRQEAREEGEIAQRRGRYVERPGQEGKPRGEKKSFGKSANPEKRRQRNHHKDGTVRSDEERADYQSRRRESGDRQKSNKEHRSGEFKGEKKPFGEKKRYDKKEFGENDNREKRPYRKEGERSGEGKKPYRKEGERREEGKKPFDKKPFDKKRDNFGKKPFDKKRDQGGKKPFDKQRDYKAKSPEERQRDFDERNNARRPADPTRKPRVFKMQAKKKEGES